MINGMRVEKRPDEFFENLALLTGKPKGNAVYHKDDHVLYVTASIYDELNESVRRKAEIDEETRYRFECECNGEIPMI